MSDEKIPPFETAGLSIADDFGKLTFTCEAANPNQLLARLTAAYWELSIGLGYTLPPDDDDEADWRDVIH